jgi:hypothetical protein
MEANPSKALSLQKEIGEELIGTKVDKELKEGEK